MDTLKQIKEEVLVCPICLRNYDDPKLLPCLHSFCGKCLSDYVNKYLNESENEAGAENGSASDSLSKKNVVFRCPVCRTATQLDSLSGAEQEVFSDNHLFSSLIEKIDMHNSEKYCESCSPEDQQRGAKAEKWCQNCKVAFCESCIKAHNVIKACRDHVVISVKDMRNNPLQSIQSTKREVNCSQHTDKILEFYCHDCRTTVCPSCVAISHRKCERVETCADSAKMLKPETEVLIQGMESQEEALKDCFNDYIKEMDELDINKKELMGQIASVRRKVDESLMRLEKGVLHELDSKHKKTAQEVRDRVKEIDALKKNLENTNRFLKNLVQYGSDSELLTVFDKVRYQVEEMKENIHKRKIAKLCTRYKFTLDPNIARIFDISSMGKIVDVVDLNKEGFAHMNGSFSPPVPVRRSSVKRTGTFRVEKPEEKPHHVGKSTSSNSLSTPSPSTSSESMSSQENIISRAHKTQSLGRRQGSRVARTLKESATRSSAHTSSSSSTDGQKTPTIERRRSERPVPIKQSAPRSHSPHSSLINRSARPSSAGATSRTSRTTPTTSQSSTSDTTPRTPRMSTNHPPSPKTPARRSIQNSSTIETPQKPAPPPPPTQPQQPSAQLLCAFNGKTSSDTKKCWPLDVAVLCDGTPVITDFHNKKVKAFDATGAVMCDVLLPSWPHGIADVGKSDLAVTLPEIATIIFISVDSDEEIMKLEKRIKTVKQYRGISCGQLDDPNKPVIVVSCCASNSQCVDVLTVEGEILKSFRNDNRNPGRTLFTWPYYVTSNNKGNIVVSDCETKTGLVYLNKAGDVVNDCLTIGVVIQDPRGICTDMDGNVYLADKSAHVIHSLTPEGKYRKSVITARDGLVQPIAVCVSPFGHMIVTQDNGDVKVYAHN